MIATFFDMTATYIGTEAEVAQEANPVMALFLGQGLGLFVLGGLAIGLFSVGMMWVGFRMIRKELREKAMRFALWFGFMMHLWATMIWILLLAKII